MPSPELGGGQREFITLLGGAAATWPLAARAQRAPMPAIGFLESKSARDSRQTVAAFHRGLNEAAFIEGQNVAIIASSGSMRRRFSRARTRQSFRFPNPQKSS
jgi:hypothetical protein